jgi:8-amino-7-oxononanoate synthase
MSKYDFIKDFLEKRINQSRLRELKDFNEVSSSRIKFKNQLYINFSSNDYLGLSHSKTLINANQKAVEKWGTGSTSSRLVCGNMSIYSELESQLASWKGTENALVFNSGYQANSSIIPAIADRKSAIFSDKLNHASIVDGIQLSRAKHIRYKHNDMLDLENCLATSDEERKIIISETLFSMDGDIADLNALSELSKKYNALLYLDDAHGSGIYGHKGKGPACEIIDSVDFYVGTFGKALGSFGAYCACSSEIKQFLINSARGLIYSTALPASVISTNIAAVEHVQNMDNERKHLAQLTFSFRKFINDSPYKTIEADSPIIPLIIGTENETIALSEYLLKRQIYAISIRPPTVPEGTCRIRFTLTSSHSDEDLNTLIKALNSWNRAIFSST